MIFLHIPALQGADIPAPDTARFRRTTARCRDGAFACAAAFQPPADKARADPPLQNTKSSREKILPEENSAAVTFLIKGFGQFICFAPNAQHIAVGQLRKVKDSCHFLRGIAVRQGVQMHEICTPHPHRHSVQTEEKPIADVNLPEADKPGNIFVFGAYRQRIASRCAVRPRIPAFRLMDRQGEPLPAMRSCPRSVGDNCSMRIRQ